MDPSVTRWDDREKSTGMTGRRHWDDKTKERWDNIYRPPLSFQRVTLESSKPYLFSYTNFHFIFKGGYYVTN
jgi:hypothetical protein